MLYFMQGLSEESGQLVRMIIGIMVKVRVFLVILVTMIIGFAAAFYILYRGAKSWDDTGGKEFDKEMSFPLSLLFSYVVMLSGFATTDVELDIRKSAIAGLVFVFLFFTIFINIIMLNLLIALMGNVYEEIQGNATAEYLYAKAEIVLEFEQFIDDKARWWQPVTSTRKNEEWFPEWLQVLTPLCDSDDKNRNTTAKKLDKLLAKSDALEKCQKEEKEVTEKGFKSLIDGTETKKSGGEPKKMIKAVSHLAKLLNSPRGTKIENVPFVGKLFDQKEIQEDAMENKSSMTPAAIAVIPSMTQQANDIEDLKREQTAMATNIEELMAMVSELTGLLKKPLPQPKSERAAAPKEHNLAKKWEDRQKGK